MNYIREEVIFGKSTDPDIYAGASEYMLYQGLDLYEALRLANKAIQLDRNSWAGNVKLKLYEKIGYYNEAIEMIKREIENTKKAKYEREKDRTDRIVELDNTLNRIKNKQR